MGGQNSVVRYLRGESADESLLQRALAVASDRFHIEVPTTLIQRVDGLANLGEEQRHEVERPIASRALRIHLGLDDTPEAADDIPFDPEWLPDGKIRFASTPSSGLHVQLANDDAFCLCSVDASAHAIAFGELGRRSQPDWSGMLGDSRRGVLGQLLTCEETSLDLAGSQILHGLEAARRLWGMLGTDGITLELVARARPCFLFKAESRSPRTGRGALETLILGIMFRATDGKDRVLAVTTRQAQELGAPVAA